MSTISHNLLDITYLDTLAAGDTPLHRIDARAKLVVTLAFIVAVVSFGRYELSGLVPFFFYPVALVSAGRVPLRYLAGKLLLVAPFAVLVGLFNPLFDRQALFYLGDIGVSGGWVSFASILLRFLLTVSAALGLIAVTGMNALCGALAELGVPRPFVVQLMFIYRYLFVLGEEAARLDRARSLRSFDRRAMSVAVFGSLAGHLLLRTLDRSERVYRAMLCRGFDGHVPSAGPAGSGRGARGLLAFATVWLALFLFFRLVNVPQLLGALVTGGRP